MSFESVRYEFQQHCYVVRAENYDNEGQQSNGGGKTSFVDIVAVALLGYSLTGRNVKDCVRWGEAISSFIVGCTLVNKQHNLRCDIQRTIYSNTKGQELVLLVNNAVPETLPTKRGVVNGVDVKLGNKYILDSILGINESDLLNYFLIAKAHYQPFLNISTDAKLDVIARFSKASVIDRIIQFLDEQQRSVEQDVVNVDHKISACDGYIQALTDEYDSDEARIKFEQEKSSQIALLQDKLQQAQQREQALIEEMAQANQQREQILGELIPDLKEERDRIVAEMTQYQTQLKELRIANTNGQQSLHVIEKHLAGVITCPKCEHRFTLGSKVTHTQSDADEMRKLLQQSDRQITKWTKECNRLQDDLSLVEEGERENVRIRGRLQLVESKLSQLTEERKGLPTYKQQLQLQIDAIQVRAYVDVQNGLRKRIDERRAERTALDAQRSKVVDELAQIKQWIVNYEDFRFFLGNKPIEAICVLANQYLQLNGSDLNLFIEGFKKLRSGELRQALQPVIFRNWANPQSFQQFSEGEKVRLNLAVDLAFQQLINESSKWGGLDLYINDELINPLDSAGVANAAKAFNQLGKTIVLVTHSGADMIYDNTIVIQKKDGRSTI